MSAFITISKLTIPAFNALEDLACDRQTGITHGADQHKRKGVRFDGYAMVTMRGTR
jgi:hypothetical protein